MRKLGFCSLILALVALPAMASLITFGSDLLSEGNNLTPSNVFITPHPVWAIPPPGVGWISYANTGMGPGSFSPPNTTIPGPPTAVFWETIFLPYGTNTWAGTFFADDTAGVTLTNSLYPGGLLLKAPNPVQDNYCAAGPIACEATEGWTGNLNGLLAQGTNTFSMDTYQRAGGPFGVMYYGSIESVPEPWTLGLIGLGLLGVVMVRRRLKPQ